MFWICSHRKWVIIDPLKYNWDKNFDVDKEPVRNGVFKSRGLHGTFKKRVSSNLILAKVIFFDK